MHEAHDRSRRCRRIAIEAKINLPLMSRAARPHVLMNENSGRHRRRRCCRRRRALYSHYYYCAARFTAGLHIVRGELTENGRLIADLAVLSFRSFRSAKQDVGRGTDWQWEAFIQME